MKTYTKLFRSPYAVPNGVQMTDDGLWIVDQITDRSCWSNGPASWITTACPR